LFKKGIHAVNFLAFMFAPTNLIVELGLLILLLLGWEFLLAELLGGLVLIAVMAVIVHLTLPENLCTDVRETLNERDHASGVTEAPTGGMAGSDEDTLTTDGGETLKFCSASCVEAYRQQASSRGGWREALLSWGGWYKVGNQYRSEWSMIWTDVIAGFLVSGFGIVFVPQWVWNTRFVRGAGCSSPPRTRSWASPSPSSASSAAWATCPSPSPAGAGASASPAVIAFVDADLITIPALNVYRKY
jgi:uncharacterized membrane protein YraQ (UPF0718 family)